MVWFIDYDDASTFFVIIVVDNISGIFLVVEMVIVIVMVMVMVMIVVVIDCDTDGYFIVVIHIVFNHIVFNHIVRDDRYTGSYITRNSQLNIIGQAILLNRYSRCRMLSC